MKFFLDIDGVMVHANPHRQVELEEDGFYKFNSLAVQILSSVIRKTQDELILSTSHRHRYDIEKWKEIFESRGIQAKFISIIEFDHLPKVTRKSEIQHWIFQNHYESDEVVIIDDDKSLNDLPNYLKERLVLTNSYVGLNNEAEYKIKLLKKKRKKITEELKKMEKEIEELKLENEALKFKVFNKG